LNVKKPKEEIKIKREELLTQLTDEELLSLFLAKEKIKQGYGDLIFTFKNGKLVWANLKLCEYDIIKKSKYILE
jgi:hypothetical protein